jgi:phosphinothricin acetyltransferase
MQPKIRPVTLDDAPRLLEIYSPYVYETAVTWEIAPPSLEEFVGRVQKVGKSGHPYIAFVDDAGEILGYAYAGAYRERYGYRFCCESSIYLDPACRGKGLGKRLYAVLIEVLRRQGFVAVIGGVSYPNPASQALHESLGFKMVGLHERIGFKFGTWHNASFFQLDLGLENKGEREAPDRFEDLLESGALSDLFS